MPQFVLSSPNAALFGFTLGSAAFVVGGAPGGAPGGDAVVASIPARAAVAVVRWGFRKVSSQKFVVEQVLGGLGLSKLATTKLADPDVYYSPDSGLILYAGAQYLADPPMPTPTHDDTSNAR